MANTKERDPLEQLEDYLKEEMVRAAKLYKAMEELNNPPPPKYRYIPIQELRPGDKLIVKFGRNSEIQKTAVVASVEEGSKFGGCSKRDYHVTVQGSTVTQCWSRVGRVPVKN